MQPIRVGFVGFGQVSSTFSKPLLENGAFVAAYDILLEQPGGAELLMGRVRAEGIHFQSLPQMIGDVDYVLSTVTTQIATKVAQNCMPFLKPGQIYLDLNSTAPSIKVNIAKVIEPSGADFVEGAILGAVGESGAKTRILVCGEKGPQVADTFCRLGLNVAYYGAEIGKASLFKMLRSIFSKGLEALLIELLIAGKRAGIERDLWTQVQDLMQSNAFERNADNWVRTHAVAYERRYHELLQVAETMREIGVEPIVTAGTVAFFERSRSLGLDQRFSAKPESVDQVIDFMEQRLREQEK